ncbi:hypothetical protein EON73_00920, partial [bacterium]
MAETIHAFNLFKKEALALADLYPDLLLQPDGDTPALSGLIYLPGEEGEICDTYQIRIVPTNEYPNRFPLLFETGGKIPINFDWHVFETDGHCCILTLPEELLICKNEITLLDYIEKQVKPYLFNQTFRRLHGYFLKERSHGITGWIEYFSELFQTTNILKIVSWLRFILKGQEPNRVQLCFCG